MNRNKHLALAALGFFLTGCTGLTKNQAALVGASVCGVMGGMFFPVASIEKAKFSLSLSSRKR